MSDKVATRVNIDHHNGYMQYNYTLDLSNGHGNLSMDWHGYQSPGGSRKLVTGDPKAAIAELVKRIKNQAKPHKDRREVHTWS